jgi:hypothetical protein
MIKIDPGIYENVRFADYQQWDAVNNSVLRYFTDPSSCPAHAKQYMEKGRKDTPALKFGRAVDTYILEPTRFAEKYLISPDCDKRSKENKQIWKDFEDSLDGREYITQEELEKIISIYSKVMESSAMRLIQGGRSQVCAVWMDKPTGLLCKSRWDYYAPKVPMITDMKSTTDASPDGFSYSLYKYGYFQQAGFYCMGHEALTGEEAFFTILALEKEEPYVKSAYELGMKTIEAGKNAARRALDAYAECKKNDRWPEFSDKITMLDMPIFALERFGVNPYQL